MKKVFLSIALLLTVSLTTVSAQDSKKPVKGNREKALKELNLSEEQKAKMESLKSEYKLSVQALKIDSSFTQKEKQEKMKALRQANRTSVDEVFTSEQLAQLKESRKEVKGKRHHGAKGKRDHGMNKGGKANFKMNAETLAKIDSLEDIYFKEKQAIKMSRIAPEMQTQKIKDLRNKFKTEKRQIMKEARKSSGKVNNKAV